MTVIAAVIAVLAWTLVVCVIFAGRFLSQRRHYVFCLVIAGFISVVSIPIGTALGVFTFIVLLRPTVKELFEANRRTLTVP